MSKVIYICHRYPNVNTSLKGELETIAQRITPDNIDAGAPVIKEDNGIVYSIVNSSSIVETNNLSVLIGKAMTESTTAWWTPGSANPDGSYALFRANKSTVEVITDVVASRTIWYYITDDIFIASSSQRAIVMLIEGFSFNTDILPWMLSTGSLGPFNSWDSRIKLVPPDSIISLDRRSWELKVESVPVQFLPDDKTDDAHERELLAALEETFCQLNLDHSDWALLLSGGYDSRAILCFLRKINGGHSKLNAITWGLKDSIFEPGNDAFVAKNLAGHYNVSHRYYHTNIGDESIETILNRYFVCGEGRIDHIGGYMDGFKIWKTLYEDKVQGIIRGDECLGGRLVDTSSNVRSRIGIPLCSDYSNLKNYVELGISEHNLPAELMQQENETLERWRDRIYSQFRMPVILAALNDLKLPYVEIVNPLLSRKIIYKVRQLPDRLRTKKVLFRKIVNSISPDIPYATISAIESKKDLINTPEMAELVRKELNSEHASSIFPLKFIQYIIQNTSKPLSKGKPRSLKVILASFVPDWKWIRKGAKSIAPKQRIDFNLIAFRMYMIIRMNRILTGDSMVFRELRSGENE